MKIAYINKKFSPASLDLIATANAIIADYESQGLSLTLRQLYYRFVATDQIENTQRAYKRLGSVVNNGRLAGHIDWRAIEDRGRNLLSWRNWDNPGQAVREAAQRYRIDKWDDQPVRVEVWVEKQALEGVVGRGCDEWDCPYLACKGYMSQSEMWAAARRFAGYSAGNQTPVIIHLGDHDPSGIDMTRDIDDRLDLFESPMEVKRIALNMDQVDEQQPPPNPAKMTDSRYEGYLMEFGDESWELDALEPSYLIALIGETISGLVDIDLWDEAVAREDEERDAMKDFAEGWDK